VPRSPKRPTAPPASADARSGAQLPVNSNEQAEMRLPVASAEPPDLPPAPPAAPIMITLPSWSVFWRTAARWLLVVLALYVVGWLIWNALPAMTPFVIGLVLAFLMLPIVNRLDRKLPRWFAILTVYVGAIVVLIVAGNYIFPLAGRQVQQLIDNLPSVDQLQAMGNDLVRRYRDLVPASLQQPIDDGVRNAIRVAQANATSYLQQVGAFVLNQVIQIINTVTFLVGFLIIPIWLFYVLHDQDQGRAFVDRILHPRLRADFWNVWRLISEILNDYIRGQLILGLAVGAMVGLGLFVLRLAGFDIRYILLLAIIAGITELIPIIGPIIGAIPGVLIGFFAGNNGVQTGVAVLIVYVVVQQLENNLLVPRIIGESIGIHPAILTVVLIAMGQIFGLLGVVLAAPLSAIGRDLFTYAYRRLEGIPADAVRRSMSAEAEEKQAAATPG
jgi:predicted PurR-regulated permease PerM